MSQLMPPLAVLGFIQTILASKYDSPLPTPAFHRELTQLFCSDDRFVAVAAPRGCAKTTLLSQGWLLYGLLSRVFRYAVLVSDTEEQAADILGDLRFEVEENETLRAVFKVESVETSGKTELVVRFDGGHRFRVLAKGAEQKFRGRKWRGTRPQVIVIDDLENEELVASDERRRKLLKWFLGSIIPALSDNGIIRVAGTILHEDSLLNNMMPDPNDPGTRSDALCTSGRSGLWRSARYQAHDEGFENLLWPEKLPERALRALRAEFSAKGRPEIYAMEYRNDPLHNENAFFAREDMHAVEPRDLELPVRWFLTCDMAISEKKTSAYTVIALLALDPANVIQVRHVVRRRMDGKGIVDALFECATAFELETAYIEKENIARSLGAHIENEMRNRGVFFRIVPVLPSKDKMQRAAPLQARMRARAVKFLKSAAWYPELESEFLAFPRGRYKDQVDSIALLPFALATAPLRPRSKEEDLEDEVEDVKQRGAWRRGVNQWTGYAFAFLALQGVVSAASVVQPLAILATLA